MSKEKTKEKIEKIRDRDREFIPKTDLKTVNDNIGMLISPYIILVWGDRVLDPKWYRGINWEWGEDNKPGGVNFVLDSMAPVDDLPKGLDGEGAEIYIEFGYSDKRKMSGEFLHSGTRVNSGNNMSIEIEGSHHVIAADQTPQRNRFFVSHKSPINLVKNAEDILKVYDLTIKNRVETDVKFEVWSSSQAETDMEYLLRNTKAHGMKVNYSYQPKGDKVILKPIDIKKRGKAKPAEGEEDDQTEDVAYYLGPGLVTTIDRVVTARKLSSPPPEDQLGTESNPTVEVKQPTSKDPLVKDKGKEKKVENTQTTKAKNLKNKKAIAEPTGPAAKPNKPVTKSESLDSEDDSTKQEEEITENKEADIEQGQIEMNTSFLMVPRVVGIKPGDVVVIMWMEEGKHTYQDYVLSSVKYSQEGAMFRVDITGTRHLEEEPMIENWDELVADMDKRGLLPHKTNPVYKNWIRYYWGDIK